jgi:hypothetical protein
MKEIGNSLILVGGLVWLGYQAGTLLSVDKSARGRIKSGNGRNVSKR